MEYALTCRSQMFRLRSLRKLKHTTRIGRCSPCCSVQGITDHPRITHTWTGFGAKQLHWALKAELIGGLCRCAGCQHIPSQATLAKYRVRNGGHSTSSTSCLAESLGDPSKKVCAIVNQSQDTSGRLVLFCEIKSTLIPAQAFLVISVLSYHDTSLGHPETSSGISSKIGIHPKILHFFPKHLNCLVTHTWHPSSIMTLIF